MILTLSSYFSLIPKFLSILIILASLLNSVQQTASRESGDSGLEKEIVHLGRGLGACRPASAACVGDEQQEPRPGAFKAAAVQEEPQIRNLGLPGMYWIMRSFGVSHNS